MKSKELFENVFEEIDLNELKNVEGGFNWKSTGSWTHAQCDMGYYTCLTVSCGGLPPDQTFCKAFAKNCIPA